MCIVSTPIPYLLHPQKTTHDVLGYMGENIILDKVEHICTILLFAAFPKTETLWLEQVYYG